MLSLAALNGLRDLLAGCSSLADLQQNRDPSFVPGVNDWLAKLEQALHRHRIPEGATVAGLRSTLIASERGLVASGLEIQGRLTTSKLTEGTATQCMRAATELVCMALRKDQERITEGERIIRQLVSLAKARDLIKTAVSGNRESGLMASMWRRIAADPDLATGAASAEALLGMPDVLVLLDQITAPPRDSVETPD